MHDGACGKVCQVSHKMPESAESRARASGEPAGVVSLTPRRALWVQSAAGPASEAVAALAPGARIVGVTKGQYGLTELLGAVLRKVVPEAGPAEVDAWAWSMAPDDARMMAGFRADKLVGGLRVLFDRSFPTRHPEWVPLLRESLGASIYATNNHAKVMLVRAGSYRLVCQSSMNFNINRRFEHFSVEDDATFWGLWRELTDWICARTPAGLEGIVGSQYHEAFKAALGGGVAKGAAAPVGVGDVDDIDAMLASLGSDAGIEDMEDLLASLGDP